MSTVEIGTRVLPGEKVEYREANSEDGPQVWARCEDGDVFERYPVSRSHGSQAAFYANLEGRITVNFYDSHGEGKYGGTVLLIEAWDGEGFLPYAIETERGIEMHIAGESEARAMIRALQMAINAHKFAK